MISLSAAAVMIAAIFKTNDDVNIDATVFIITGAIDAMMICGVAMAISGAFYTCQ